MADESTYGFNKADAGELIQLIGSGATEFSEEWPTASKSEVGGWLLKTTSTISARSGTTLGSGSCIICTRSGSTIVETAEAITAYNSQGGDTIPSGVYVQAKRWQGVPLIDEWDQAGGRVVVFELTSGFTSGVASADFEEIDGTPIESGSLLDPTEIVGSDLSSGAVGLAFKRGSQYVFLNAKCGQDEEEA